MPPEKLLPAAAAPRSLSASAEDKAHKALYDELLALLAAPPGGDAAKKAPVLESLAAFDRHHFDKDICNHLREAQKAYASFYLFQKLGMPVEPSVLREASAQVRSLAGDHVGNRILEKSRATVDNLLRGHGIDVTPTLH